MPHCKSLPEAERQQRRRARALKKQAHKRAKRRAQILTGLDDPFMADMIERSVHDSQVADRVPLPLVPTRQLRRRVAELNQETRMLSAEPALATNSSDESASPESPIVVDPSEPSTVIPTPRRIGRRVSSTDSVLPFMPDQQRTLHDIFHLG